ncbi:uncharacterized protein [Oscarella lobularis]|uniref:uncharacterized protein n=1 Tax=Oscarella lobularis TaxID=121494 RepID=UPI0033144E85
MEAETGEMEHCDSGKPKKRKKRRFYRAGRRVKRTGPGRGPGPSTFSYGSTDGSTDESKVLGLYIRPKVLTHGGRGASPRYTDKDGTAAAGDELHKLHMVETGDARTEKCCGTGDAAAIRSTGDISLAEVFGDRSSALNSSGLFLQNGRMRLDLGSALANGATSRAVNSPLILIGSQQIVTTFGKGNGSFIVMFSVLFGMLGAALLRLILGSGRQ